MALSLEIVKNELAAPEPSEFHLLSVLEIKAICFHFQFQSVTNRYEYLLPYYFPCLLWSIRTKAFLKTKTDAKEVLMFSTNIIIPVMFV